MKRGTRESLVNPWGGGELRLRDWSFGLAEKKKMLVRSPDWHWASNRVPKKKLQNALKKLAIVRKTNKQIFHPKFGRARPFPAHFCPFLSIFFDLRKQKKICISLVRLENFHRSLTGPSPAAPLFAFRCQVAFKGLADGSPFLGSGHHRGGGQRATSFASYASNTISWPHSTSWSVCCRPALTR